MRSTWRCPESKRRDRNRVKDSRRTRAERVPGSAEEDESREETQGASRQDFTGEINAEIEKIVDSYMEEARAEFPGIQEGFF